MDLAVSLAQAQGNINNATIGAVVATSAGNKVTFENYARSHDEGQLGAGDDPIYYFQMYGPAGNAAQTWHSQGTTGANR